MQATLSRAIFFVTFLWKIWIEKKKPQIDAKTLCGRSYYHSASTIYIQLSSLLYYDDTEWHDNSLQNPSLQFSNKNMSQVWKIQSGKFVQSWNLIEGFELWFTEFFRHIFLFGFVFAFPTVTSCQSSSSWMRSPDRGFTNVRFKPTPTASLKKVTTHRK